MARRLGGMMRGNRNAMGTNDKSTTKGGQA